MDLPTRFGNLLDLARLPCFEERSGSLVVVDPSMRGAVDVHTHLALSYVFPNRVDLARDTRETLHYLPAARPLDLEVYANLNFTEADLSEMRRDLMWRSLGAGGMRATHTAGNLAREMADLGLRQSVLLPIELPGISRNAETWLSVIAGRPEFVGFGSVHPMSWDIEARLDAQKRMGARGVKLHPAAQMIAPDHPRVARVARACGERGLAVFFHCGPVGIEPAAGRRRSQVDLYRAVIEECPGTVFVLGHSGALQLDKGIDLARRYDNVWLEIASQPLEGVRRILGEADPDRFLFGTDWPFYHQAMGLAKVYLATAGREALRERILFRNAERLLGLDGAARVA